MAYDEKPMVTKDGSIYRDCMMNTDNEHGTKPKTNPTANMSEKRKRFPVKSNSNYQRLQIKTVGNDIKLHVA